MNSVRAFDWLVVGVVVGISGWIGLVLTRMSLRLLYGLVGVTMKVDTIIDVLYERVKRIRAAR